MAFDSTEISAIAEEMAKTLGCTGEKELDIIASSLAVKRIHKNDLIYREHTRPEHIVYLVSGKVKIVKECCAGRAQIVRAIKEHTFVGYRAFFAQEEYTTSAMAFEDSTVAFLPLEDLELISGICGNVVKYFLKELAVVLGQTDCRIVSLTQKHIRGRLAETILALKKSYGFEPDGQTINIAMNRDDLASLSNMSTSNAIRTLSAFAQEGSVSVEGRKIKILDETRLLKISDMG